MVNINMSRDNALTWPNILPGIKPTHCPVGVILQHVGIFANHVLCPNVTDKNIKNNCLYGHGHGYNFSMSWR